MKPPPAIIALAWALFEAVLLGGGSSLAQAQDYKINLHRPKRAGEQYRYAVDLRATVDTTLTSEGKIVKEEKNEKAAHFEAVEDILEADSDGDAARVRCKVKAMTRTLDGAAGKVIREGATIEASRDGTSTSFRVDGEPVTDPEMVELLKRFISVTTQHAADDAKLAPAGRVKVGGTWKLDPAQVKEVLQKEAPFPLSVLNAEGQLAEVSRDGCNDLLTVKVHITCDTIPSLAPNTVLDSCKVESIAVGKFPATDANGEDDDRVDTLVSLAAHIDPPAGGHVILESKSVDKLTVTAKRVR